MLSPPSPSGRQEQSCILPCPQGAAPLSPTSNPVWMEGSPAPAPLFPRDASAGRWLCATTALTLPSLPPVLTPQAQTLQSQWTHLPDGASRWQVPGARRAAHRATSPGMHIQSCSHRQRGAVSPSCHRALVPLPHPTLLLIALLMSP